MTSPVRMPSVASETRGAPRWQHHLPPVVAFTVNAVAAGGLLVAAGAGAYAYPLDDTYIHMITAWNWWSTGVYGLNAGEFSSPSTSPAWVVALAAGFAIFGKQALLPLALELLCSAWLFVVADRRLRRAGLSPIRRVAALLVVVAAGLPVVTATAMEHLAQAALVLLLVAAAEEALAAASADGAGAGRGAARSPLWFAAIGGLLPLVRVETLLLVALVGLSLWRDRRRAAALVGGAVVTTLAFAVWNHHHGGLWLPNTLIMKSIAGRGGWEAVLRENLSEGSAVFLVVGAVAGMAATGPARTWLLLLTAGHFLAGSFGWLGRYEAYLVVWGLLLLAEARVSRAAVALGAAVLGAHTFVVAATAASRVPYVHDLKVVAGIALGEVAPGATVCLHDVGAVAWYGRGARIVDVAGLGTDAVAREAQEGILNGPALERLCREGGATLAFTGTAWAEPERPQGWEPVGTLWWGRVPGERLQSWRLEAVVPGARAVGERWMDAMVARSGGRAVFVPEGTVVVALDALAVDNGVIRHEGGHLALYTNGSVSFAAPRAGQLWLTVSGTAASDGPARLVVRSPAGEAPLDAPREPGRFLAGTVHAEDHVEIAFVNDATEPDGVDRNAFVWRVEIDAGP